MNALQKYDTESIGACHSLVGVDEVGRGCLAGPVMAAACRLKSDFFSSCHALGRSSDFKDSKKLSASKRTQLWGVVEQLRADALLDYAVGMSSVDEIATLNILGATRLAMQRALDSLVKQGLIEAGAGDQMSLDPNYLYLRDQRWLIQVDGRPLKPFPYPHRSLIKGDGRSLSIAIASVVAKARRDAYMEALDRQFPAYGFAQNKGYGTKQHRIALKQHGAISEHRALFLRKVL
jgi:ribonuclease HII